MLIENGGGPAWSPNGQEIAFVRQTAETLDIYRMDADGSNVTPLVESDSWHEGDMDWR
jgi:Tol biopolymer transport system component